MSAKIEEHLKLPNEAGNWPNEKLYKSLEGLSQKLDLISASTKQFYKVKTTNQTSFFQPVRF